MRAMQIAEYLKEQNTQRQQCERKMLRKPATSSSNAGASPGPAQHRARRRRMAHRRAGIVASRLVDRFFRPSDHDQRLRERERRGAGLRPVHPRLFHVDDPGVRVAPDEFRRPQNGGGVDAGAGEDRASPRTSRPTPPDTSRSRTSSPGCTSTVPAPLRQFTRDVVNQLDMLGPFGEGNPKPVLRGRRSAVAPRRCGSTNDHRNSPSRTTPPRSAAWASAWAALEKKLIDHEYFNIAYEPTLNHFNGNSTVEFAGGHRVRIGPSVYGDVKGNENSCVRSDSQTCCLLPKATLWNSVR